MPLDRGIQRAAGRESADVQLVNHIAEHVVTSLFALPGVGASVEYLGRPVYAPRLCRRAWIRAWRLAVDGEQIVGAGRQVYAEVLPVAGHVDALEIGESVVV